MWRIVGRKFSWSRIPGGQTRIWVHPEWHVYSPNLNQANPDFEYDEVIQLNAMKAYLIASEGNADDLICEVKASHRDSSYSPEPGDVAKNPIATVTLINSAICFEIRLEAAEIEKLLSDLIVVGTCNNGYFSATISGRLLDLTRSIGVRPDAKEKFLAGDLTLLVTGNLNFSYSVVEAVPSRPNDNEISNLLLKIARD